MKQGIHPKYSQNVQVNCNSCGKTFLTGSIVDDIRVEICSNCHPFYTGKAKIVDTENLVKKFEDKRKLQDFSKVKAKKLKVAQRSQKVQEIKAGKTLTLRDMLKQMG